MHAGILDFTFASQKIKFWFLYFSLPVPLAESLLEMSNIHSLHSTQLVPLTKNECRHKEYDQARFADLKKSVNFIIERSTLGIHWLPWWHDKLAYIKLTIWHSVKKIQSFKVL